MESHISKCVDMILDKERLDRSIKEVLADVQILARILKYTLEEFESLDIDTIIGGMSEIDIAGTAVDPGLTNTGKVHRDPEEDSIPGEGRIVYDIRFSVRLGEKKIKILINIEAQRSTRYSRLGYHLDNRVIYYLARMISAQKEVEFTNSNYDDIKAVRSIWICMDAADDEDSINRIRFEQETVYGKEMILDNIDKVQAVFIRLRKKDSAEQSRNTLIAMLEELLRKEDAGVKRTRLSQQYGIHMSMETERRLENMCNLSEVFIERGIEQGIDMGEIRKLIGQIIKKIKKNKSVWQIADELESTEDEIAPIYDVAIKYAPDYDERAILDEVMKMGENRGEGHYDDN